MVPASNVHRHKMSQLLSFSLTLRVDHKHIRHVFLFFFPHRTDQFHASSGVSSVGCNYDLKLYLHFRSVFFFFFYQLFVFLDSLYIGKLTVTLLKDTCIFHTLGLLTSEINLIPLLYRF